MDNNIISYAKRCALLTEEERHKLKKKGNDIVRQLMGMFPSKDTQLFVEAVKQSWFDLEKAITLVKENLEEKKGGEFSNLEIPHAPEDRAKALYVQGLLREAEGNMTEAIKFYKAAFRLEPKLEYFDEKFLIIGEVIYDCKGQVVVGKLPGDETPTSIYKVMFVGDQQRTTKLLLNHINNFEELAKVLQQFAVGSKSTFDSLNAAISKFTKFMCTWTNNPVWNFYTDLLPNIVTWACDFNLSRPLSVLLAGQSQTLSLTTHEVLHILANAFFLNVNNLVSSLGLGRYIGMMDFHGIYSDFTPVAVERVLCQLSYFAQANTIPLRNISFERFVLKDPPDWENDTTIICKDIVNIHTDVMEMSSGRGFVDFANEDLHIGTIIPSMTQEEVLFSCCPECFVGLLFVERFQQDEAMIIRGVQRFSKYTGYGLSFKFVGFDSGTRLHDIIVIDACTEGQYRRSTLLRDLNKAWLGFVGVCGERISTGHWGCGAFGGNKTLKFIQQVCAATKAQVTLDYSTYGENVCAQQFTKLLNIICEKKITIGSIFKHLIQYTNVKSKKTFDDWFLESLLSQKD